MLKGQIRFATTKPSALTTQAMLIPAQADKKVKKLLWMAPMVYSATRKLIVTVMTDITTNSTDCTGRYFCGKKDNCKIFSPAEMYFDNDGYYTGIDKGGLHVGWNTYSSVRTAKVSACIYAQDYNKYFYCTVDGKPSGNLTTGVKPNCFGMTEEEMTHMGETGSMIISYTTYEQYDSDIVLEGEVWDPAADPNDPYGWVGATDWGGPRGPYGGDYNKICKAHVCEKYGYCLGDCNNETNCVGAYYCGNNGCQKLNVRNIRMGE